MRRKIFLFRILSMFFLIFIISTNVKASEEPVNLSQSNIVEAVSPNMLYIYKAVPNIFINGSKINVEGEVYSINTKDYISGTLYLQKYENGYWKKINSWRLSGYGSTSISKSVTGAYGYTYRSKIDANVRGETATRYSNSVSL